MIWFIRIVLFLAAIGIMALEGAHQRQPGVGFAIACTLMGAAALIGHKENEA